MGGGGRGRDGGAQHHHLSEVGAADRMSSVTLIYTPSRDLPTFFTWEFPSPFQILPTTGLLEPGQASCIKVTFHPLMATVYEVQATCWYGESSKQKRSIQLQAVGEARLLTCSQSPPAARPGSQSLSVLPPPPLPACPPPVSHSPPALQALSLLCLPWCGRPVFPRAHLPSSRGCSGGATEVPGGFLPKTVSSPSQPNVPSCW